MFLKMLLFTLLSVGIVVLYFIVVSRGKSKLIERYPGQSVRLRTLWVYIWSFAWVICLPASTIIGIIYLTKL